jgi:hypothetical protein
MRCLLHQSHLLNSLWLEAIKIACYFLNRHITKSFKNLTLQQAFIGRKKNVFHLCTFGTLVHVHILAHQCNKMDPKASKCIFLGRSNPPKATVVIVHLLGRSSFFGTSRLMNLRFLF